MESQDQDAIIYRKRPMPGSLNEKVVGSSDISPIVNKRKAVSAVVVSEKAADCSDSSPIAPIVIKRRAKEKGKVADKNEKGRFTESPPAGAAVGPKVKSRRHQMLKSRFLDLQCKEDKGGESVAGSDNSSDDNDEANLSNVSENCDHSNAERHVYLESLASQNKFPTPIRHRRFKESGQMSICGAQVVVSLLFQMYDDLVTDKIEMDIRNRKAARKQARLREEAEATAAASAAASAEVSAHEVPMQASPANEPAGTGVIDVFSDSGMILCTGTQSFFQYILLFYLMQALTEQLEKEWHAMQAAKLTDTRDSVYSIVAATAEYVAPTKGPERGVTSSSSSSSSSSRCSSDVSSTLFLSMSAIQSGTIVDTANIQHMSAQLPSLNVPRIFWEKENVAPVQDALVGQSRAIKNPGRLSLKGRKNMTVPSQDVGGSVIAIVKSSGVVSTTGNDILEAAVVVSTAVISDHVVVHVDDSESNIGIEDEFAQCHLIDKSDAMIVCRFSSTNELWTLGF
jgi:hypothetical protein